MWRLNKAPEHIVSKIVNKMNQKTSIFIFMLQWKKSLRIIAKVIFDKKDKKQVQLQKSAKKKNHKYRKMV